MSNALAVPTVTAAISTIVQARINAAGVNPQPLVGPAPLDDKDGGAPAVGVHLYRVSRNGHRDNEDLVLRGPTGVLKQRPRTALDLHYLLTFRGSDEWESARLLGITAAALHAVSVLGRDIIGAATARHPRVAGNDLADADEQVRITPEPISFDEITKLFALFEPGAYVPTLAYVAGPVIVESDQQPAQVYPVRQYATGVRQLSEPRVDWVAGPDGPSAPIRAAANVEMRLLGAGLAPQRGETLQVLLDGRPVPNVTVVSQGELSFALPPSAPGHHLIQVRRVGAPLVPAKSPTLVVVASESAGFLLLPVLVSATANVVPAAGEQERSATIGAEVLPAIGPGQRVRLLLDRTAGPALTLALDALVPDPGEPTEIQAVVEDPPAGTYRVTLEVEGTRSIPGVDPNGHYQHVTVQL